MRYVTGLMQLLHNNGIEAFAALTRTASPLRGPSAVHAERYAAAGLVDSCHVTRYTACHDQELRRPPYTRPLRNRQGQALRSRRRSPGGEKA